MISQENITYTAYKQLKIQKNIELELLVSGSQSDVWKMNHRIFT